MQRRGIRDKNLTIFSAEFTAYAGPCFQRLKRVIRGKNFANFGGIYGISEALFSEIKEAEFAVNTSWISAEFTGYAEPCFKRLKTRNSRSTTMTTVFCPGAYWHENIYRAKLSSTEFTGYAEPCFKRLKTRNSRSTTMTTVFCPGAYWHENIYRAKLSGISIKYINISNISKLSLLSAIESRVNKRKW